ncbi:MAG TPA: glycosyltransferase, partial [Calditrichia bacterium]|nr:glycosyltransferase [Calditrichia bacterium]
SPAYYEDTDLCFGVRSLGYKVFYQPASRVVHHEGKSAGTDLSSGMKRFQVINRDKFVEKWDAELAEQQVNHPANVVKASNRNIIGNIFIADPMFPIFDRASGSLRLFSYIKILREMGYHVTFLARVGDQRLHYAEILRQLGVEVHSNDNKALMAVGLRMEKEVPEIPYKLIFQERFFEYAIMSFWNIGLYYIPLIRQLSPETHIVVDTVDIHFLREKREAELKNDSDLMDQAEKNMRLEIFTYMSADSLWVVTDEDRKAVQPALKDKPIYVVPNIHKEVEVRKSFGETEGLFFVGNYNHLPNVDGVHFFMKEIWPLIQKALPEVPLVLGGQQPPPEIQAYEGDKVAVPGFVESLDEYLTGARVSVSPLRYGAGMKGKIGEALSWGLPVVSTTIGAEGMGLKDETHA